jgi:hypothetical protein
MGKLIYIWKVLGLDLSQDTNYPHWDFHGFPQALQANDATVPHVQSGLIAIHTLSKSLLTVFQSFNTI